MANFHLVPVGKPAPPRPRRPDLEMQSDDFFTGHFGEHLGQGLIAVKGDVLVDIFGVDDAAVAQGDALLLLVEADFVQGLDFGGAFVGGALIQKLGHDTALDQVLFDDFVDVFDLNAAIESAFRIYDNNGAGGAQAEAAGLYQLDFLIQALFGQQLGEALVQLRRTGRSTAGTAADQDRRTEKVHYVSLLLT